MSAQIKTVAFHGVEPRPVDVQVQILAGLPNVIIVGLPDKAVAESRERVRAALSAIGLGLPPKRIIINLAPADLPKEGSHFDLPIALALLVSMGVIQPEAATNHVVLGELSLDGRIAPVCGVLPAAIAAHASGCGLVCPASGGGEAAWSGLGQPDAGGIIAPESLLQMIHHFKGVQTLPEPKASLPAPPAPLPDMADVRGQETARRALEVTAAGGHNMLMIGPPGSGKSMLAQRLAGLLPPLESEEMLEVSMIASVAGTLADNTLQRARPFRSPHHSASMAAMVGGGTRARPGEVSLAHMGVLFLDELAEFARPVLDALRQPVEGGTISIARVHAHVTYPARFQLIAAMNPCRCGFALDPAPACSRRPKCMVDYQARVSGPLLDRFDMRLEVPPVPLTDMTAPASGESSSVIAKRVAAARHRQAVRYKEHLPPGLRLNTFADGELLRRVCTPDEKGQRLLERIQTQTSGRVLSARGYHRVLRVARTIADLEGRDTIGYSHLAEALHYRAGTTSTQAGASLTAGRGFGNSPNNGLGNNPNNGSGNGSGNGFGARVE